MTAADATSSNAPLAVSVALCTFNGGPFVAEQLASIATQVPRPAQIVVSDDGSTDQTMQEVRSAADAESTRDIAFTIIRSEQPLGVTANFERAMAATSHELVVPSDQDDRWHDHRVDRIQKAFATDPGLTLLHTDAVLVDGLGSPLGRTLFASLEVSERELRAERSGEAFRVLLRRNLVTGATMAFRRELLEVARPFPEEWVHDEWLAIVAAATGRIGVLTESTIDYRQHGGNQIGVARPTLRYKVSRVLEPRGDRNRLLAARFAVLASRLAQLGDRVRPDYLRLAQSKATFEAQRAELPRNRARRIRPVLSLYRTGAYRTFASRGSADVIRDLLQPAGPVAPRTSDATDGAAG